MAAWILLAAGWPDDPFDALSCAFAALALVGVYPRLALAGLAGLGLTSLLGQSEIRWPPILSVSCLLLASERSVPALSLAELGQRLRENIRTRRFVPIDPARPADPALARRFAVGRTLAVAQGCWEIYRVAFVPGLGFAASALGFASVPGYTPGIEASGFMSEWTDAIVRVLVAVALVSNAALALYWIRTSWVVAPLLLGVGALIGLAFLRGSALLAAAVPYAFFVPFASGLSVIRERRLRAPGLEVYYDDQCPLCIRTVTVLQYFDLFASCEFRGVREPASELRLDAVGIDRERALTAIHAVGPRGDVHGGVGALERIARAIPLLWPLASVSYIPGARAAIAKLYAVIAKNRPTFRTCEVRDALPELPPETPSL